MSLFSCYRPCSTHEAVLFGLKSPVKCPTKDSKPHTPLHCYLQLKLCGKQSVDLLLDAEYRTDVSRRNEQCEEEQIYIVWVY